MFSSLFIKYKCNQTPVLKDNLIQMNFLIYLRLSREDTTNNRKDSTYVLIYDKYHRELIAIVDVGLEIKRLELAEKFKSRFYLYFRVV